MTGAVFEIYLDVYCRAPFLFKGTASSFGQERRLMNGAVAVDLLRPLWEMRWVWYCMRIRMDIPLLCSDTIQQLGSKVEIELHISKDSDSPKGFPLHPHHFL